MALQAFVPLAIARKNEAGKTCCKAGFFSTSTFFSEIAQRACFSCATPYGVA
jgi:hypothetical protein